MTGRSIGLVLGAFSATLGGHGALVQYGQRVQVRVSHENEVMTTRVVRDEVDKLRGEFGPLHADIDRAHTRIDELWRLRVAMKEQK